MAKRVNGDGTIRQRKDGTWEARITTGIDPISGKQIRRSVYGGTKKDVRKKMTDIINSLDKGIYQQPSKITVAMWLDEWMTTFCANKVKPLTYSSYESLIRNHINPKIGNLELQSITGIHIQRIYNGMIENGSSPKTVRNVGAVLHKAFDLAVKQRLIYTNPCDSTELPRVQKHEIKPFSTDEIALFLKAIELSPYRNAYALCLFAGLRESECMGLSWDQVDIESGKIVINQQLQKEKKRGAKYYIATPKNSKPRIVQLPPIAVGYLKDEMAKQCWNKMRAGDAWSNPYNLVFTNEIGGHYRNFTFYKNFKNIVATIGRPDARPHDLRHTAATIAIASGADIKSVQDMMGHATASFTLNVYTHTSEQMRSDTAVKMQEYYEAMSITPKTKK